MKGVLVTAPFHLGTAWPQALRGPCGDGEGGERTYAQSCSNKERRRNRLAGIIETLSFELQLARRSAQRGFAASLGWVLRYESTYRSLGIRPNRSLTGCSWTLRPTWQVNSGFATRSRAHHGSAMILTGLPWPRRGDGNGCHQETSFFA